GHPEADGVSQVNVALPEGVRTGLVPVEVRWLDQPLCAPEWVRIIPGGPAVPSIYSVTDGVNLLSGSRIISGAVKVTMHGIVDAECFGATVGGIDVLDLDAVC